MSYSRIHVLDEQPLWRRAVVELLERREAGEVVGTSGSLAEGRENLSRELADLLIMGLRFPDGTGFGFLQELRSRRWGPRVLVVSNRSESQFAEQALRMGASGFLMKTCREEELLEAVAKALAGELALSAEMASRLLRRIAAVNGLLDQPSRAGNASFPLQELSGRELEVFELLGNGGSSKEIGAALGISHRTVDTHRHRIREKLGLQSTTELALAAARWRESGLERLEPLEGLEHEGKARPCPPAASTGPLARSRGSARAGSPGRP